MNLADLQGLFWRSVRYEPEPPEAHEHFRAHHGDVRERVAVYRRMFWYRQVEALFDTLPRTARALGGRQFTEIACRYLAAHPSQHPALERIGRHFAQFMRDERGADVVADLAALEHARLFSFLAPDGPEPLSLDDINPSTLERASLAFAPSLEVVTTSEGALMLFKRVSPDAPTVEGPSDLLGAEAAEAGPLKSVMCFRVGYDVVHRPLPSDEAAALTAARSGATFATICEHFQGAEDVAARAFAVVRTWFDRGLVNGLPSGGS